MAGFDYVSPLGNTLGFEFRRTQGQVPTDEFVPGVGFVNNDYDEHEISLVATYALGTQLRSAVRVGRTSRKYDQVSARDFDGNTGRIFLDWLPGNKTILGFEAYHEPRSVVDVAASHVVFSGVVFGPRWAVTNKVVLSARFVRENRKYEGDPALAAGGVLRDEDLSLVALRRRLGAAAALAAFGGGRPRRARVQHRGPRLQLRCRDGQRRLGLVANEIGL